jgi:hypothetical protein
MPSPLPRHSAWRCCLARSLPSCQPSPIWRSGRPVQRPFRGLLSVHSRYGLYPCWITYSDPLQRGFHFKNLLKTGHVISEIAGHDIFEMTGHTAEINGHDRVKYAPINQRFLRLSTASTANVFTQNHIEPTKINAVNWNINLVINRGQAITTKARSVSSARFAALGRSLRSYAIGRGYPVTWNPVTGYNLHSPKRAYFAILEP